MVRLIPRLRAILAPIEGTELIRYNEEVNFSTPIPMAVDEDLLRLEARVVFV